MTKPIIIDGADVSGCRYWSGTELGYCNAGLMLNDGTHICECEQNCYYKQLQRKKQEAERYYNEWINCSKQLDYYKDHEQYMQEKHYDLTMENNLLKEKYKPLEDEYFNGLDIKTIAELAKKSIRLSKENRELEEENEKLRAELEAECENSDKKENELRAQLGKNNHLYKEKLRKIREKLNGIIDCGKLLGDADEVISEVFTMIKESEECLKEKKTAKLKEELENLTNEKNRILNLAKQNADSSEYCMRELEEQNEELKKQNESLRNHISDLLQQLNDLKEEKNEQERI